MIQQGYVSTCTLSYKRSWVLLCLWQTASRPAPFMEDEGPPNPVGTSSRLPLFVFWSSKSFLLKWQEVPTCFLLSGTLRCLSVGILSGVPTFLHSAHQLEYLTNTMTVLCFNNNNFSSNPSAVFVLLVAHSMRHSTPWLLTALCYCYCFLRAQSEK